MMNRTHALRLFAGGAAAPFACARARAADTSVRIVTTPNETAAEPYFAEEMGFFRASGLDAEVTTSANGAQIAAAVVSGAADIGNSSVPSLAQAHAKGIPLVIIAPGGLYDSRAPSAILFLPKQSDVKEARELNGKTIGINNLRGLPQFGTEAWLDAHGAQSKSVHFVEMAAPAIIVALRDGKLDAGLIAEPFITSAREAARPLAAVFDAAAPSFMINAHFATLAWAKEHASIVRSFLACIEKTAAWANKNPARSGDILMKYTRLTSATLATMHRTVFAETLTAASLQPAIDLTSRYGGIARFPAEELVFRP